MLPPLTYLFWWGYQEVIGMHPMLPANCIDGLGLRTVTAAAATQALQ